VIAGRAGGQPQPKPEQAQPRSPRLLCLALPCSSPPRPFRPIFTTTSIDSLDAPCTRGRRAAQKLRSFSIKPPSSLSRLARLSRVTVFHLAAWSAGNPVVPPRPSVFGPQAAALPAMASQQILFAETIAGMKKAFKRKAYGNLSPALRLDNSPLTLLAWVESDSDSEIENHGNRGNKLKKRARFARQGQLAPTDGPSFYREVRL